MINVLFPGFYTTVQDLGRNDYESLGVPTSGAMDQIAAKMANAIIGNDNNYAVLEITMVGPKLEFSCDTVISIAGADLTPQLNEIQIHNNKATKVRQGDILSFGKLKNGFRTYLAVSGGFLTETKLKSRSMYKTITKASFLKKGNVLDVKPTVRLSEKNSSIKFNNDYLMSNAVIVYKGPEFDKLNADQQAQLFNKEFTISKDNNRMAYQLNELVKNNFGDIITSLVLPGTVQLTPSGKLIILMRDCQTTGGYPRVLQLSVASINLLAQKFIGSKIKFTLIN